MENARDGVRLFEMQIIRCHQWKVDIEKTLYDVLLLNGCISFLFLLPYTTPARAISFKVKQKVCLLL